MFNILSVVHVTLSLLQLFIISRCLFSFFSSFSLTSFLTQSFNYKSSESLKNGEVELSLQLISLLKKLVTHDFDHQSNVERHDDPELVIYFQKEYHKFFSSNM